MDSACITVAIRTNRAAFSPGSRSAPSRVTAAWLERRMHEDLYGMLFATYVEWQESDCGLIDSNE